ncbi:MAG: sirohydrochlorin chelatase [Planctomycetota bacterium]|nr:sirohydrochlorin chelatase [Planctomycetota bacterium]
MIDAAVKLEPLSADPSERPGILLIGHGTRDPVGQGEFLQLAGLVAEKCPDWPVEAGFLELAEPSIAVAFERLLARAVQDIVVVPALLFSAGHAQRDIPDAILAAAEKHSVRSICMTPALQCNPLLLELSARRYREAIESAAASDETFLLMVGRGSSDESATAEMRKLTQLRAMQTPISRFETCFVAVQRPTLVEGLEIAAASGLRRIVVQPHLLFAGQLLTEIRQSVNDFAIRYPDRQWIMTAHLGPEPELAAALLSAVSTHNYSSL